MSKDHRDSTWKWSHITTTLPFIFHTLKPDPECRLLGPKTLLSTHENAQIWSLFSSQTQCSPPKLPTLPKLHAQVTIQTKTCEKPALCRLKSTKPKTTRNKKPDSSSNLWLGMGGLFCSLPCNKRGEPTASYIWTAWWSSRLCSKIEPIVLEDSMEYASN